MASYIPSDIHDRDLQPEELVPCKKRKKQPDDQTSVTDLSEERVVGPIEI